MILSEKSATFRDHALATPLQRGRSAVVRADNSLQNSIRAVLRRRPKVHRGTEGLAIRSHSAAMPFREKTMYASKVAAALAIVTLPIAAHAQDKPAMATAKMMDKDGKEIGTVTFKDTSSGQVQIIAEMAGIPAGAHGFHVHETGKCDAAGGFESAGAHYAGGMKHGFMAEGGPHAGDLPNVHATADGVIKVEFFTDRLSLREGGKNPLKDADGSAIVLHAQPDDYSSQPSGESGDRIACGVIE
jgi:superoxide dismutase, Cu-Zn family